MRAWIVSTPVVFIDAGQESQTGAGGHRQQAEVFGQLLGGRPRVLFAACFQRHTDRAGGVARPADLLLDGAGFYLPWSAAVNSTRRLISSV
jgi:hypothetical protein